MHDGERDGVAADGPQPAEAAARWVGVADAGSTDAPLLSPAFAGSYLRATQLMTFGRYAQVDRLLADAGAQAAGDYEVALAAVGRASVRFWHLGSLAGAHAVLDEAAARIGDGVVREDLVAQRAVLYSFGGRTGRGVAALRGARRRGRAGLWAQWLGVALEIMGYGLRGELIDPPAPPWSGDDEIEVVQLGSLHLATYFARTVNGVVPDAGGGRPPDPQARAAMAALCEGTTAVVDVISALWAGRPREAHDRCTDAIGHLRHSDRIQVLPIAHGQRAYALALVGDAAGATLAAEEAEACRHPVARLDVFFVGRGGAWAAAARGEVSTARQRLSDTAEACERHGQAVLAAQAWYDLARLGDPGRAASRLTRLARWAATSRADASLRPVAPGPDGPGGLIPLLAAHATALAADDAVALAEVAGRLSRRGHRLHAAEAAAQVATLHTRAGRAEADRWRRRAAELSAGCEGARTPALTRLRELDLTPRESEVVGLAARGLTNPDIARRLHLSVRTVGNHLQAAYAKLGIHRREELAGLHPFGAATG
jgi:DNA-binding CsgD family transcriptional regulator